MSKRGLKVAAGAFRASSSPWAPRSATAGDAAAAGSLLRGDAAAAGAQVHSQARVDQSAAASPEPTLIPFPREGPGVSYALNWALAGAGVTPAGTVSRNLKPAKLAGLAKGSAVKPASGSKLLVSGSKGDTALAPAQFKKLLKEVTSHLSGLPTLFVHDGAVGSSSSSDARVRVIGETAGAAAALAEILTPTPTRTVVASSFPITLYAVPSLKNEALGSGGFVAADLSNSLVVAAGSAVGDAAALKAALSAAAMGPILKRGALSLPGRLVAGSGSQPFIVLAPTAVGDQVLAKSAAWDDLGLIWGPHGVARQFSIAGNAPNLYLPPSALVLLTSDSTGAIPTMGALSPKQAAFYFLAGYDGSGFNPAFARSSFSLGSADALTLAQALAGLVASTSTPTYLVNAAGQSDVGGLVTSVVSGKVPAAKPASAESVTQLNEKLTDFVKGSFPNVPEDIVP